MEINQLLELLERQYPALQAPPERQAVAQFLAATHAYPWQTDPERTAITLHYDLLSLLDSLPTTRKVLPAGSSTALAQPAQPTLPDQPLSNLALLPLKQRLQALEQAAQEPQLPPPPQPAPPEAK